MKSATLRRLLEAVEILHSHGHSTFEKRLFRASSSLFLDAVHSWEVIDSSAGTHAMESDLPLSPKEKLRIQQRSCEVVPLQHPIFPLMMGGLARPVRLSDLMSYRDLYRTDLYHDVFRPACTKHQLIVPFNVGTQACGLTSNRATKNYSIEDIAAAELFSRHLAAAFSTDQLLRSSAAARQEADRFDHSELRRKGLTRREREVLWWVAEGKANVEIAVILSIAAVTVEYHLTSIYRKLGVENRMAAVASLSRPRGAPRAPVR